MTANKKKKEQPYGGWMRAVSQVEKGEAKQNERERCLGANPSQRKYHSSQQPKTIKNSTDFN